MIRADIISTIGRSFLICFVSSRSGYYKWLIRIICKKTLDKQKETLYHITVLYNTVIRRQYY